MPPFSNRRNLGSRELQDHMRRGGETNSGHMPRGVYQGQGPGSMSSEHPWRASTSMLNAEQTRRDGESIQSEQVRGAESMQSEHAWRASEGRFNVEQTRDGESMESQHPWRVPMSQFNAEQTRRDGKSMESQHPWRVPASRFNAERTRNECLMAYETE